MKMPNEMVSLGLVGGGHFYYLITQHEDWCGFRYLRCLRHLEYYINQNGGFINKILFIYYKIKLSRLGRKYLIQIAPNVCGYGLRIMHLSGGGGLLINAKSVGNYCGFNSGVLIGNNGSQDNRPIIGDHVAFGPGAKAFGSITIENNVFVAPNAVVVKNVPENCIVGGVPAKIIKYNNEDK